MCGPSATGFARHIAPEVNQRLHKDARFFGVLDLAAPLAVGVALSVGVRNSVDKSFPLGFAAGSRVFVCDNLAFRSELLVRRKHTANGLKAFGTAIAAAVAGLASFQQVEAARIREMSGTELTPERASHVILTALRRGVISALQLPKICHEWEQPRHEDFRPRTAWSLFNAFTEILKDRAVKAPQAFVAQTIRLNALVLPHDRDLAVPVFAQPSGARNAAIPEGADAFPVAA